MCHSLGPEVPDQFAFFALLSQLLHVCFIYNVLRFLPGLSGRKREKYSYSILLDLIYVPLPQSLSPPMWPPMLFLLTLKGKLLVILLAKDEFLQE